MFLLRRVATVGCISMMIGGVVASCGDDPEPAVGSEDGGMVVPYHRAFLAFQDCVSQRGGHLTGVRTDPVTGFIDYEISDVGRNVEIVDDCYWREFQEADAAFQTTDPAMLAQQDEENLELLIERVIPCLVANGHDVPDEIGPELAGEIEIMVLWMELDRDGRC